VWKTLGGVGRCDGEPSCCHDDGDGDGDDDTPEALTPGASAGMVAPQFPNYPHS
jgi:hypothetical protein